MATDWRRKELDSEHVRICSIVETQSAIRLPSASSSCASSYSAPEEIYSYAGCTEYRNKDRFWEHIRICLIVGIPSVIRLPCLPLDTAVKSLQLQKHQCPSMRILQPEMCTVHNTHYTVSNAHSCNKRAHITQNMYIHGSHTRLTYVHGSHVKFL